MKKKFIRSRQKAYKRLSKKWRKPKGRHNKMREKMKSHGKLVNIGRKKPVKVERGKEIIRVRNIGDLEKIKDGKDKIIVFGRLGKKKKQELKKAAEKLKLEVGSK